ncbi:ATP-binding cassette domain-containing protein [Streptomyces sp. NPDC001279]|uniref:ATP-binding cassette domain-containing protein n=1 Tax=Streptomyces sp. NPDC001279 TaxID=3364556 RepID=UPI0036BD2A44
MTALTSNPLRATVRGPWAGFVLRRTRRLVVSLAALVTAAFAMIHLIPGDPVRAALGPTADPALIEARRHSLGLDESLPKQFGHFVGHLFQGRLGDSIGAQMPVSEIVAGRLPATLQIAVPAFALILLIAVPVGMTAAVLTKDGRRRQGELAFTGITGLLGAVPEFLLAVGLIAAFAVMWPLFPVASRAGLDSYVLPILALAVVPAATLSRIVRVETLRVLGEDYMRTARRRPRPHHRPRIGDGAMSSLELQLVFQNPYASLDPRMTIGASVAEALPRTERPRGTPARTRRAARDAEVARCLELVGIDPARAALTPDALSGGQRQRVALARALAARPGVLIADEITSALDVSVQGAVLNLLRGLQRELGFAMLFISHDLAVVRHLSDQVAVMDGGRLVERGPAERVLEDPEHPTTRDLISCVPTLALAEEAP